MILSDDLDQSWRSQLAVTLGLIAAAGLLRALLHFALPEPAQSVAGLSDDAAKVAGVYKGRPPSIEASRVRELKAGGMRPTDIAKALKIGRASVYRVLAAGN
jgi:hypothetical protein